MTHSGLTGAGGVRPERTAAPHSKPAAAAQTSTGSLFKRAFVSEPEISRQKWNILVSFRIFHLCNGCSIKRFLPLQRPGTRRRSICATRTPLCYPIAKDKNSQNISKIEQKSSVLTRTLSVQSLAHTAELNSVSYTHLRAHETSLHLVCRLLLEKKNGRARESARTARGEAQKISQQPALHAHAQRCYV